MTILKNTATITEHGRGEGDIWHTITLPDGTILKEEFDSFHEAELSIVNNGLYKL